jgi:lipase maturation factor 1
VNTYHLFASITRERVEPQVEALVDGRWMPQHLAHKPGDPGRAPDFVAPHQPRVDFQLWFHAFSWQRGRPEYLQNLLQLMCYAPETVQPLFPAPLPREPAAVRLSYLRYHFTTRAERRSTGAYWRRILVGTSDEVSCDRSTPSDGGAPGAAAEPANRSHPPNRSCAKPRSARCS